MSESPWLIAALWVGLALLATLISIRAAISVALIELIVGAVGRKRHPLGRVAARHAGQTGDHAVGQLPGRRRGHHSDLSGRRRDRPGRRPETFLVQHEHRDGRLLRPLFRGAGVHALRQRLALGPGRRSAGLPFPTTSVAVVYAVMVETGFNRTRDGQDHPGRLLCQRSGNGAGPGAVCSPTTTSGWWSSWWSWESLCGLCPNSPRGSSPRWATVSASRRASSFCWCSVRPGRTGQHRAQRGGPAGLPGRAWSWRRTSSRRRVLAQRLRVMAFTLLTPFYFLKAGSLVKASTVAAAFGLIAAAVGRQDAHQVPWHLALDERVSASISEKGCTRRC